MKAGKTAGDGQPGKSSLAFGTLYAEAERPYPESVAPVLFSACAGREPMT
jgi:excinuclease UvrABC ATPase subunit